jgi:hypothetical protein
MDSKHRHELQRNDLAYYGGQVLAYLDKHGNAITVVICVIAIAAAGYTYWSRTTAQKAAVAWNDLEMARKSFRSDDLAAVARNYPDSDAAVWGSLLAAEQRLPGAIPGMYENRELALADLKRAMGEFKAALSHPKATAALKSRAQFGLARCIEATSGEDLSDAIKAYEAVVASNDPIYKSVAEARIKVLQSESSRDFYKWFASLNPKPPAAPERPADRNARSAAEEDAARREQDELFEQATRNLEKLTAPKNREIDAAKSDPTSTETETSAETETETGTETEKEPARETDSKESGPPADAPTDTPADAPDEPNLVAPEPVPSDDTSLDANTSEDTASDENASDETPAFEDTVFESPEAQSDATSDSPAEETPKSP